MKSLSDFPHWAIKLIGTVLMFLLTIIFGVVPLKLSRSVTADGRYEPRSPFRQLLISLANCFAGGVFFSTVVLDLFPMVKEEMTAALLSVDIETEFPIGDFFIGFGFILMLIIETFVHSCCGDLFHKHREHSKSFQSVSGSTSGPAPEHVHDHSHALLLPISDDDQEHEDEDRHHKSHRGPDQKHVSVGDAIVREMSQSCMDSDVQNMLERSEQFNDELVVGVKQMQRTKSLASMNSLVHSSFRAYVLVLAISLHSLFEGLAAGLITKVSTLLQIFFALFIHKSIIAFSVGVQLVDGDLHSKAVVICILIFAAMTPIGVGLGIAVLDTDLRVRLFFSGILQGIASGTFLYVTFFEVLPHELNIEDDKKPLKIAFVLLGYAAITGVCYFENRFHKVHPSGDPTAAPSLVW